jgi:succinate dehydrogenase flavin-adding protein (antitoxin of CptAB toxin-antitoxin module)
MIRYFIFIFFLYSSTLLGNNILISNACSCTKVNNLVAYSLTESKIKVTFSKSKIANKYSLGYKDWKNKNANAWTFIEILDTSYMFRGLKPWTEIEVKVALICKEGILEYCEPIRVGTIPDAEFPIEEPRSQLNSINYTAIEKDNREYDVLIDRIREEVLRELPDTLSNKFEHIFHNANYYKKNNLILMEKFNAQKTSAEQEVIAIEMSSNKQEYNNWLDKTDPLIYEIEEYRTKIVINFLTQAIKEIRKIEYNDEIISKFILEFNPKAFKFFGDSVNFEEINKFTQINNLPLLNSSNTPNINRNNNSEVTVLSIEIVKRDQSKISKVELEYREIERKLSRAKIFRAFDSNTNKPEDYIFLANKIKVNGENYFSLVSKQINKKSTEKDIIKYTRNLLPIFVEKLLDRELE